MIENTNRTYTDIRSIVKALILFTFISFPVQFQQQMKHQINNLSHIFYYLVSNKTKNSNFAYSISPQLNQKQIPISHIIPSLNPPFSQQPIKNLIFLITQTE